MRISTRLIFLTCLFLLFVDHVEAQILNQDQEGYSTLVFPGANLGLDLSNNVANFSYYHARPASNKQWLNFWGLELKGKEKEGLVNLFSGGSPAVGASGNLLLGHRWFGERTVSSSVMQKQQRQRFQQEDHKLEAVLQRRKSQALVLLAAIKVSQVLGADDLWNQGNQVLIQSEPEGISNKLKVFSDTATALRGKGGVQHATAPLWNSVESFIALFDKAYLDAHARKIELLDLIQDIDKDTVLFVSNKFFLRGGLEGVNFRLNADVPNSSDLDERFPEQTFTGWNVELGYNWQLNKQRTKHYDYLGFTYRLRYMNNIDGFESHDFSLTQEDTTFNGGKLTTTTKVTALDGSLETFYRHSFSFDYARAIEINTQGSGEPSNLYLVLNPYLRHHIYQESSKLKNNMVLGFGLHAYSVKKQRIMGGLFIQTNDLFGVHADDDSNTLGKRISVGLVARFNFSGFDLTEPKT